MTSKNTTDTAALYVRISEESETSTSIERQEETARAYATSKGWTVSEVYSDRGISGGKDSTERPGLARLMADAEAGRFEVVVVAKLDRLARSLTVWNDIRADLARRGVALASVAESLDLTTPAGRAMANILATFAEFERERIAERIAEARRGHLRDGRFYARQAPYGWRAVERTDGPGLRLGLDPHEAPLLREFVADYLGGRCSMTEAARSGRLTYSPERLGKLPKRDEAGKAGKGRRRKHLTESGLRDILTNPILLGHQAERRYEETETGGRRHTGWDRQTGPDGLPLVAHDALVTPEEFRRLAATIEGNRNGTPRSTSGLRLLNATGVLRCGVCSKGLRVAARKGKAVGYECKCGKVSANAEALETMVEEFYLSKFARLPEVREEHTGDPEAPGRLADAIEARGNVRDLVAEGLLPMDEARERLATLAATIENLETLAAEGPAVRLIETGRTLGEVYAAADLEGRRDLLAQAFEAVLVDRGRGSGRAVPLADRVTFVPTIEDPEHRREV